MHRVLTVVVVVSLTFLSDSVGGQLPLTPPGLALTKHGLTPVSGGQVVYDSNLNVYWLADANLAADPTARAQLGASALAIGPDGTMDYPTAQDWVRALNNYNFGAGYLGQNNWQLPTTPPTDTSCAVAAGASGNSFGPSCKGSAFGNLYSGGLTRTYPDSIIPAFSDIANVGPFANLQPSLYWTSDVSGGAGRQTFSFGLDFSFANTTRYNYFHVLPLLRGFVGSSPPSGSGAVVPYPKGSAAHNKAVYDTISKITWALDANLAASHHFGITGNTTIPGDPGKPTLRPPWVDPSGTMLYSTTTSWLTNMNTSGYAGASFANPWTLPTLLDLQTLDADLQLQAGDSRLTALGNVGPFQRFQPFFYWACQRDPAGSPQSACDGHNPGLSPNGQYPMQWSFNFDEGFQGTDEAIKRFRVMVYFPAPAATLSVACPVLPVTLSAGSYTTLPATNAALVASNSEMECAYTVVPLRIAVTKGSAQNCPQTALASVQPVAPWNAPAAGTPTSTPMSLASVQNNLGGGVTCAYQSAGAVTLATWAYSPTGYGCSSGPNNSFVCHAQ